MPVELTESLLQKCAGWDVVKRARSYVAAGQVSQSSWQPPHLEGLVQNHGVAYRAGLKIESAIDVENLCTCREAREWGKICAHSVAVALHWLAPPTPATRTPQTLPNQQSPPAGPDRAKSSRSLQRGANGDPAKLFILFPPDLEPALARGKIMLVFEAQWADRRAPLNALPRDRSYAFPAADAQIIDRLEAWTGGETPALLSLELRELEALLPLLVDHPRLSRGRDQVLHVAATPCRIPLCATFETDGEIRIAAANADWAAGADGAPRIVGNWVWRQPTWQPLGLPDSLRNVTRESCRISRADVPRFLSQHWPQLQAAGAVVANFQPTDFSLDPQTPRFELALRGGLAQLRATLRCTYGTRSQPLGRALPTEELWWPDPDHPRRYLARDLAAEQAAQARLQRSGFQGPDATDEWRLEGQDAVLNFFARDYPHWQHEWRISLDEHLTQRTLPNIERIEPRLAISSSGMQWFDLDLAFSSSGGTSFSPAEIQQLLRSGRSHTRLKNGKFAVLDTGAVEELQETLLDCAPQQHAHGYRIPAPQAGFLEATLRQYPTWQVQAPAAWRDRAARQSGAAMPAPPPLGPLETVLRPYQKQGVAWLQFLRQNRFGGILADEMGLGKTLQALAHLQLCRLENPLPAAGPRLPHLIVCPTSLVFNWLAEARKFVPGLRLLALHGPQRHRQFEQIPACDLVVTTYALIRRDAEKYRGREFDTVILDEAQHIKNRRTQNAQAVKAIRAEHRVVLTGTPLENSVQDLWSIFDFLMPGYLGGARDFHERYEVPILKARSTAAQTRLARRLRPFLLRRLKRDVAPDLPAKLEQVAYCELTTGQRAVYQQVLTATRQEVLTAAGAADLPANRLRVLTALLRLRQICCDLRLLPQTPNPPPPPSGKFALFAELVEQILDGGHRALVFSQFVEMLQLLKAHLEAEGIAYCYLDGTTTERARVVEQFQTQRDIPLFLISLKAGGVGLNLTGADTVIHFDPWWNPAVEDQATDRAHRLGQHRVVTSYKLIARDTVEEKILRLQQRKRDLIAATVGGEAEFAATLSWEEIQALLA